jgi:hypothetical protein
VEAIFEGLPTVTLPPFFARLGRAGAEIYEKKIGAAFPLGTRVRMKDVNGFFALGEVREYPDGLAIKALKLFVL